MPKIILLHRILTL